MRNQWIKDRLKELGKRQIDLAAALGHTPPMVNKMVSGLRRVHTDDVPALASFLEWPVSKVLGLIAEPTALELNVHNTPVPVTAVRVLGEVEAGVFKEALEYVPEDQFEIFVPVDPRFAKLSRGALKVRGPSMNLLYPEGTFIVFVPVIELGEEWVPRSGNRVVVQRSNDQGEVEATIKEVEFDQDGQAWLWPRSSHPEFQQPWRVPAFWDGDGEFSEHSDNLRIVSLVVGSYRHEG